MERSTTVATQSLPARATTVVHKRASSTLDGTQLHVLAWGDDGAGQCLGGARSSAASFVSNPSIVRLPAGRSDFAQIGAGWEQSFLVSGLGSLWAGGSNRAGCLSSDRAEQVLGVQPVDRDDAEDLKVAAVVAGREHFVAIHRDGSSLSTWGCSNEFGQTGQGLERIGLGPCSLRTFAVQPGVKIHAVACGQDHALALSERGEVFAWGDNMSGQLGRSAKVSSTPSAPAPQRVEAGALRGLPVRQIAAGAHHSLVLGISGQVVAWGSNRHGRLGLGQAFDDVDIVSLPTPVAELGSGVRSVAGGGRHSAVVLRKGVLLLAGDNRHGQLGHDPDVLQWSGSFLEMQQEGDFAPKVRTVALGDAHSLLLTYEGELYGVGSTDRGQLGEPIGGCVHVPRLVRMPDSELIIWSVAAGPGHSLVLASEPGAALVRTASREPAPPSASSSRASVSASPARSPPSSSRLARTGSAPSHSACAALLGGVGAGAAPSAALGPPPAEADEDDADGASGLVRTMAFHGAESRGGGGDDRQSEEEQAPLERLRSVGCGSKLASSGKLVVPVHTRSVGGGGYGGPRNGSGSGSEALVLLRPVVRPGVAAGVGFLSFTVDELAKLVQDLPAAGQPPPPADAGSSSESAEERLRSTVAAALRCPTVLGSCFLFPALNEARLNAGGLCEQLLELRRRLGASLHTDEQWALAALQGLQALAPAGGLLRNVRTRDQVRPLVLWLLVPNWHALLASYIDEGPRIAPKAFDAAKELLLTVARLPAEGRAAIRDVVAEECGDLSVLRDVMLLAARALANAAVRHCIAMQTLAKPVWEAVLLLQILAAADMRRIQISASAAQAALEADQEQGVASSQEELQRLGRTLSTTAPTPSEARGSSASGATAAAVTALAAAAAAAHQPMQTAAVGAALPRSSFEISALVDLGFPPDIELLRFAEQAKLQAVDPSKVCEEAAWDMDPKTGELPTAFQSFMANGNLVPVAFKRSVLHVESTMRQRAEQHRQIMVQAGGVLQILPITVPVEAVFFVLTVRRDRLLEDTASALRRASQDDLKKQLKVKFANEEGVDEGGVTKEYFRVLSEQLFSADYGMFAVDSESRYLWLNQGSFVELDDFEMVGTVIGLAVYNNLPGLDVNFPPALFKKLKDLPVTLDDLAAIFPSQALSLQAILKWQPPEGSSPEEADRLFQDIFCLDFSVSYEVLGEQRTATLLESEEVDPPPPVTLARRGEFAELFKEWYLTKAVAAQFDALRRGFDKVCRSNVYKCLSAQELEAIVCGERDLDFARLRKGAQVMESTVNFCDGYLDEFWEIAMSFDGVQKRQFLKFVTGSDLAPVGGLERVALKIQRNGGEPTARLPTSQTCFNLLMLPEYADGAKLRRLLTTAIENAEGFGLQ